MLDDDVVSIVTLLSLGAEADGAAASGASGQHGVDARPRAEVEQDVDPVAAERGDRAQGSADR